MQRRFEIAELQAFLKLVDEELPRPCTVVIVGPTALMLGYCPNQKAFDIELWRTSDSTIFTAAERAGEKVPRPVRVHQPLAGEPTQSFESRLQPVPLEGLHKLTVLVPEAHDLAIISAAHGESLERIADLHASRPLSLDTLVERFREMRSEVSWPRSRFKQSFQSLLARLFGPDRATAVGKRL